MERHVDKRSNRTSEISLAMWLQNGRAAKGMSLDDVARVTKIQPRILERLEAGKLDGLPAEVFVRGFVRSFARCVGLDEDEALRRLISAQGAAGPKTATVGTSAARAMVEAMGDLAPNARAKNPAPIPPEVMPSGSLEIPVTEEIPADEPVVEAIPAFESGESGETGVTFALGSEATVMVAEPVIETPAIEAPIEVASTETVEAPVEAVVIAPPPAIDLTAIEAQPEPTPPTKKKRTRKAAEGGSKRKRSIANGTPAEATPVIASSEEPAPAPKRRRKAKGTLPIESILSAPVEAAPVEAAPVEAVAAELPVEVAAAAVAPTETTAEPGTEIVVETTAEQPSDVWVADLWASEMGGASLPPHADESAADRESAVDIETTQFDRPDVIDAVEVELTDGEVGTWTPKMPPIQTSMSAPWRRPNYAAAPALVAVIDDADPESAERALEERRSSGREARRTFLPPILLDREGDRSARQGGLTLAVIILLIAATLTLSYLMRRPSASGDGVTSADPIQTLDTQV